MELRRFSWRGVDLLLSAMALSGLTLILQAMGWMGWLDAAALRLAGSAARTYDSRIIDPEHPPVSVVDIDADEYARAFGQRSPLDRKVLASLIVQIARQRPAVLAIDIDLSPFSTESPEDRAVLDDALRFALGNGVNVVLASPTAQHSGVPGTQSAWIEQIRSTQNRSGATIEFASSQLSERLGMLVRYDEGPDSLAATALTLARGPSVPLHTESQPLLPAALDPLVQLSLTWRATTAADGSIKLEPPPLSAPIVLLGGSFERLDQFSTVLGPIPGLRVHAAALISMQANGGTLQHPRIVRIAAYAAELAIGISLGWMWRKTLIWYERAVRRPVPKRYARALGAALEAWAFLAIALLAIILPGLLTLRIAAYFLAQGAWINPAPLLFGMLLDAMQISAIEPQTASSLRHIMLGSVQRSMVQGPLALLGLILLSLEHS